ncbi:dTDP-4-dehydrorhamnose reductase [Asticcacaulis solisilvae]|uniref:dTDP-4-dehydrorhamnose reductase n=1 Tax=Asticcacaulis solisilvae TaxID=1217274 RepID=UPI003FD7B21F
MRILVTGRSGQMGRAIAHVNHGHDLVVAGRPELEFERPDLIRAVVDAARPDVVINCAGMTQVDACEGEAERAFAVNAYAPGRLAEAAAKVGAAIIHLSTDYVFDGAAGRPYREDDPARPVSVYGRSKLAGEDAVIAANPRHAVVRVSWVYSRFADNFLSAMLRYARTRPEISVVDDQVSCPTPGVGLAAGLLRLAEGMGEAEVYGRFHLAGAEAVDRATLVEAVMAWAAEHGQPFVPVRRVASSAFPTPAPRPLYTALDSTKIREAYGIELPGWRSWFGDVLAAVTRG